MYVVLVELQLKADCSAEFMREVESNALTSRRREPGCLRFDITVAEDDEHRVILYECYSDQKAFQAHLASAHFVQFDRVTSELVQHKRIVTGYNVNLADGGC